MPFTTTVAVVTTLSVTGTVTDADEAQQLIDALHAHFPELDSFDAPTTTRGWGLDQVAPPTPLTVTQAGSLAVGTLVRILQSRKPQNVGVVATVADEVRGEDEDNIITLTLPSGRWISFNSADIRAGKLAVA